MPTKTSNLWERQPGESAKAYAAFCVYRSQQGRRSYARVSRELGKSKTIIDRWGRRHHWRDRVRAFDDMIAGKDLAKETDEILEMRKRHRDIGLKAQSIAVDWLNTVDGRSLKPHEAAQVLRIAREYEMGAFGLDKPGVQVNTQVNVSTAITEENVLMVTRLYPLAYGMLNEKQRAQLDTYRKELEAHK